MVGKVNDDVMQSHLNLEYEEYMDIVQGDFIDTYYKTYIKTMMSLKWAMEYCSNAK